MLQLSIIRTLRNEKRLSKVALAKKCGVSRGKIKRMEDDNYGVWGDVVKVFGALGFELKAQLVPTDQV